MPTFDEALEKANRLCIDLELFEQVEDYKLEKELEQAILDILRNHFVQNNIAHLKLLYSR
jgi:hypothetical protein